MSLKRPRIPEVLFFLLELFSSHIYGMTNLFTPHLCACPALIEVGTVSQQLVIHIPGSSKHLSQGRNIAEFIFNFVSSSLNEVIFIDFKPSSSNFCQLKDKFKTRSAFLEFKFSVLCFSRSVKETGFSEFQTLMYTIPGLWSRLPDFNSL